MRFSEIVKQRLAELGLNVHQAEKRFGFRTGFLRSTVRQDAKESSPTLERAKEVCAALGLEFYIGPFREIATEPTTVDEMVIVRPHPAQTDEHLPAEQRLEALAFPRSWLNKQEIGAPVLIRATDEAMGPTVPIGTTVLVDRQDCGFSRKPALYAILYGGTVMVRCLELSTDWVVMRPNSLSAECNVFRVYEGRAEGLAILGRVRALLVEH